MKLVSAVSLMLVCAVGWGFVPAAASAQCSDCSPPQSDVSGGLVQSDVAAFQPDGAPAEVNVTGLQMTQGLQAGRLTVGDQSVAVPALVADVLTTRRPAETSVQALVADLTAHGLSQEHAQTLAEATAGLLGRDRIPSETLVRAIEAFNEAVDAAPASFLSDPPSAFVVLHAVLTEVLQVATS